MNRRAASLLLIFLPIASLLGQTAAEKKATIDYLRQRQNEDGGFAATKGQPSSLRLTSSAIRALKYFGGEVPDRTGCAKFVAACWGGGGFTDRPDEKKPDVFTTAVGLMAVVELKLPVADYANRAIEFLGKNAMTFEEIRIAAAGLEALGKTAPQVEKWQATLAAMANEDGTFGKESSLARDTGGAVACQLRLGVKLKDASVILKTLKSAQREDGGYGKADAKGSDLETTYRVVRAFVMLKDRPDAKKLKALIARCRNDDGGYGVQPGQPSTIPGTYYASILLHWLSEDGAGAAAPFKAGFAERDISPKIGMEQPGGYGKAFHQTFHDPCKVRASVFDDGSKRVAIVGIDALSIRAKNVNAARVAIEKRCGIPANAVMIAASHSHSSGPTSMILPGEFDDASELVQKLAYKDSSTANLEYLAHVEKQIVDAVCAANDAREEVRCGIGKGIEDKVAFNRRFRMKSGLTYTHPRQGNPDIKEVAGPTDPEVGVLGAWDTKGKFLGCVVNFSCHATTNPGGISANYVCYLEKAIQGFFGDKAVVVFVNGASADVTQVDNLSPYANPKPEQWAMLVGGRVGAEAVKVLLAMEPGITGPVDATNKVLKIKRRAPAPEKLQQALDTVKKPPKDVGATTWTFAKETVLLDAILKKEPVADVEMQAIQVGPLVLASTPAEYFCAYGLEIKKKSKFSFTFPVSLANDCVGYVPTEEAFSDLGGGYETRLTSYSNLEITAGTQMAKTCIELANSLTPGKVPERAKAPAFSGTGWEYGNVPPERK